MGAGVNRMDRSKPLTEVDNAGRPRWIRRGAATLIGGSLALAVAGCGSSRVVKAEPAPVIFASPSPTPSMSADPAGAILVAYREFFARQTEISAAPKEQRRALLEPFTTDPALDRVLRGMYAAEGFGEVGYGAPVVNPTVSKADGDTATVTDCQDGREAGRKNVKTGKITTRGVKQAKAVVTLNRGDDGAWRVATIAFPDEPCGA